MTLRPAGHDCPDCGSQMYSNDTVCGVPDAVRVLCPICGAVFSAERTEDGFYLTGQLLEGAPCPHDETRVTDGNGRWEGNRWVQDRVEMCDDCGEVLGVL